MLSALIWPSKPSFSVSSAVWIASSSSMSSLYLQCHDDYMCERDHHSREQFYAGGSCDGRASCAGSCMPFHAEQATGAVKRSRVQASIIMLAVEQR